MRFDGYIEQDQSGKDGECLNAMEKQPYNRWQIKRIDDDWIRVMNGATDRKARCQFYPRESGRPIEFMRACQGHSDSTIDNTTITTKITRWNQPEVTIHTTQHCAVQPILSTGIKPGGPQGSRNEFLSQPKWTGDAGLTPGSYKLAPIGIQWDCIEWTDRGMFAGITAQKAISVSEILRRPFIVRVFHMRKNGIPRPCDIIYERRRDCPES